MKCINCPCKNSNGICIYEKTPYVCNLIKEGKRDDLATLALKECTVGGAIQKIVEEPSMIQKGINFTSSIFNHILTGMAIVSDEVQQERINICENCVEYFDAEKRICKHEKCGCPIDKKCSWASESCPIDKWGSVNTLKEKCGCGQ